MKLGKICPICKKINHIELPYDAAFADKMDAYESGMLIQNAFPDLTPEQREFIKTGICNACWPKVGK